MKQFFVKAGKYVLIVLFLGILIFVVGKMDSENRLDVRNAQIGTLFGQDEVIESYTCSLSYRSFGKEVQIISWVDESGKKAKQTTSTKDDFAVYGTNDLVTGDMLYRWNDVGGTASMRGTRINIGDPLSLDLYTPFLTKSYPIDGNQECRPWKVDSSVFELPRYVDFQDLREVYDSAANTSR